MGRKAAVRLGIGEFDRIYDVVRYEWDREVKKNLHSGRGFHSNLAKVLGISQSAVYALAKNKGSGSRLTCAQKIALAARFKIPLARLMAIACQQAPDLKIVQNQ